MLSGKASPGTSEVNTALAEPALLGQAGTEADLPGTVFSAAICRGVPTGRRPHQPGAAQKPDSPRSLPSTRTFSTRLPGPLHFRAGNDSPRAC